MGQWDEDLDGAQKYEKFEVKIAGRKSLEWWSIKHLAAAQLSGNIQTNCMWTKTEHKYLAISKFWIKTLLKK